MAAELQPDLQVFEYGGTARAGKGSIVSHFEATKPGIATEETGADYRAITHVMLEAGDIDPDMSAEVVGLAVETYGSQGLTEIVEARKAIVEERGLDVLYTDEVARTVWKVSPHNVVRKVVKAGFRKTVEAMRDDPETDILVIDGRNLKPVIESIPGTRMIMQTYVSCDPLEAALRDCARRGIIDIDEIGRVARGLAERNRSDAGRKPDAVRPDDDAIDYWQTGEPLSNLGSDKAHADTTRFNVGMLATTTGRQILFDTGEFRLISEKPREAMLVAARQMFDESLTAIRLLDEARQRVAVG